MEKCKNCDNPLNEGDKFCSNCGQKTFERLRLKTLLGELAATFFAWDSKLFKTLALLLFKPGRVSRAYTQGKRKGYVAPLRMYFFFSVVFFFIFSTFPNLNESSDGQIEENFNFTINGDSLSMNRDTLLLMSSHNRLDELEVVKEQSGLAKTFVKQAILMDVDQEGFRRDIRHNLSMMLFLFIPIIALILKVAFWNNDYDYIEHLIYGLYFHSFMFFILILCVVISRTLGINWQYLVGFVLIASHLFLGLKFFYQRSWFRTTTKFIGVTLSYIVLSTLFLTLTFLLTLYIF